ncbi:hypothetical protein [Mycolicibacterium fortuitum]|uniref:hypothetical protein n=1 Tax=Mycolicibacterium fortuitum TaxID=1766 RepID=UPI000A607C0A|nr:hypothetical protein [Mycolicibacterium fortuitum]NOP98000.1 hypothetical protein [Mycolicibacterium fortuitum]
MSNRRVVAISVAAAVVVLIAVAVLVLRQWSKEDTELYGMKPYTAQQQQDRARTLIDELNTHDPKRVGLRRGTDARSQMDNARLDRLIQAAMPLPGCSYSLDSVTDRGEQGERQFWWGSAPIYRYDMNVTESCPNKPPLDRVLGVLARPTEGAHWTDALIVIDQ